MTSRASVTQAEMQRAIKAVQAAGLSVHGCKIENGAFSVITEKEPEEQTRKTKLKGYDES